jgi:hypothetical protein
MKEYIDFDSFIIHIPSIKTISIKEKINVCVTLKSGEIFEVVYGDEHEAELMLEKFIKIMCDDIKDLDNLYAIKWIVWSIKSEIEKMNKKIGSILLSTKKQNKD